MGWYWYLFYTAGNFSKAFDANIVIVICEKLTQFSFGYSPKNIVMADVISQSKSKLGGVKEDGWLQELQSSNFWINDESGTSM